MSQQETIMPVLTEINSSGVLRGGQ